MKRNEIVLRIAMCVGLAVCGGCLSLMALVRGALFNAVGHGSSLPLNMFIAPAGLGMLVWPLSFAVIALPRKFLPIGLLLVLLLIALHGWGARHEYHTNDVGRAYLQKVDAGELHAYAVVVYVIEGVAPVCIVIRIVLSGLLRWKQARPASDVPVGG